MEMKMLVFDIWGDFAHFKRIETTTSPLTYPFPMGTALSGLVAAIIGLERDSYYEIFSHQNLLFGVRILNPIRKTRINLSFINTKYGTTLLEVVRTGNPPHTLIPLELIKDPKYRIYLQFNPSLTNLQEKLKKCLEEHETFYTPYLGISELIANFEFVGEFDGEYIEAKKEEEIHSVLKIESVGIVPEEGKRYGRETIPLYMDTDRKVIEYGEVVYEMNGQPIRINEGSFYNVNGEHIILL